MHLQNIGFKVEVLKKGSTLPETVHHPPRCDWQRGGGDTVATGWEEDCANAPQLGMGGMQGSFEGSIPHQHLCGKREKKLLVGCLTLSKEA